MEVTEEVKAKIEEFAAHFLPRQKVVPFSQSEKEDRQKPHGGDIDGCNPAASASSEAHTA